MQLPRRIHERATEAQKFDALRMRALGKSYEEIQRVTRLTKGQIAGILFRARKRAEAPA